MKYKNLIDFFNLFKEQRKEIIFLVILSTIAMIFEAIGVAIVFPFLEIIFAEENKIQKYDYFNLTGLFVIENYILILGIMMILIFTIKALFLTYFAKKKVNFTYDVRTLHTNKLFKTYIYSPLNFHLENNSGNLIRNLNDSNMLSVMARSSIDLLAEVLVIIGIMCLLFYFNPTATGITILVFGAISIIFYKFIKKRALYWGTKSKDFRGLKLINLKEGFGAIREIKILGKEKFILNNFSQNNFLENFYTKINTFFGLLPKIWFEWLTVILILFLISYFSKISLDKVEIIPILGVYAAASYRLIPSLVRIVNLAQEIRYCYPAIKPYLQNQKKLKQIELQEKNQINKKIKFLNFINLKDVDFNYKKDQFVLKKINFKINKGSFVGIYGESGSGKTTLINIILGLFNPSSGKIFVDNLDISKNLKNWQKLISYIPQNVYIIDDTILKNVAFGEKLDDINKEKVDVCLKKSNIYNFIYGLKDNVHTISGELGEKLSGGQRQRLAIARALYQESEILVFDEFTNFLDKKNEFQIIEEIKNMKDKTRILITHSEDALRNCDTILELKDSKVYKKK